MTTLTSRLLEAEDLTLYRGVNASQDRQTTAHFYHEDPEFARQFTQSGQAHEVLKVSFPAAAIFRADPLPYGGDPDQLDYAIDKAKEGGFRAIYADEGSAGTPSVLIFRRGPPLRVIGRCSPADFQ